MVANALHSYIIHRKIRFTGFTDFKKHPKLSLIELIIQKDNPLKWKIMQVPSDSPWYLYHVEVIQTAQIKIASLKVKTFSKLSSSVTPYDSLHVNQLDAELTARQELQVEMRKLEGDYEQKLREVSQEKEQLASSKQEQEKENQGLQQQLSSLKQQVHVSRHAHPPLNSL